MNEEDAESRGPATAGVGPSQDESVPSAAESPTVPPGAEPPPNAPPPWFDDTAGPTFAPDKLVRPAEGRYVAGVCAALGRATNTDPVLWRVLLAVLGFFSGVGVLIYLVGWLLIPSEGHSASPVESLLGRGRSGMQPISVILLGGAAALTFALVVHGGFRATLVAVAVVAGAAMLLRRTGCNGQIFRPNAHSPSGAAGFPFGSGAPSAQPETAFAATAPPAASAAGASAAGATTTSPSSGEPLTEPLPPTPPNYPPAPFTQPNQFTPPTGGYRPPFAPHGPWAGSQAPAYYAQPPAPRPPKPPRERSKLGRITFFAVLVVIGTLALISSAGVSVPVSGFFAAALATIGLGLILGTWLGRARGLIFLAILATLGLGASSGAEQWGSQIGRNDFRPKTVAQVADRYDFNAGEAVLDLRAVDFSKAPPQNITVAMKLGQVKVLLPANVDTTAAIKTDRGRAQVFGQAWSSGDLTTREVVDPGADGPGGGTLNLTIHTNTGNVEVSR